MLTYDYLSLCSCSVSFGYYSPTIAYPDSEISYTFLLLMIGLAVSDSFTLLSELVIPVDYILKLTN